MVLLYAVFPSAASAGKAALSLLEGRLAACANIMPCSSLYRWKGRIELQKEFVAIFKTSKAKVREARVRILKRHPYDVPCVIELAGKANRAFEKWAKGELR